MAIHELRAPGSPAYWPGSHDVHSVANVPEYEPERQELQPTMVSSEYWPGLQLEHVGVGPEESA